MAEYIEKDAFIRSIEGNPFTTESVKSYIRVSVKTFPAADVRENTIRTQADRIRAMSDEELAVLLEGCICPSNPCKKVVDRTRTPDKKACQSCWLDWLQSSAAGGDTE